MVKIHRAARILLFNSAHKILLMKVQEPADLLLTSSTISYWMTPGGKIEKNEQMHEAALRELYEETGIHNAPLVMPHLAYVEVTLVHKGTLTLFQEWFFLAHAPQDAIISTHNFTEEERATIVQHKWWSLEELKATPEKFFPENLCELLEKVSRAT